jgi:TIR domain/Pentapeptide repeats (8 copies)
MANRRHLAILAKGTEAWNEWRAERGEPPDLNGADLSGAFLGAANFRAADLVESNLTSAVLNGSDFFGARMQKAISKGAILNFAHLRFARMDFADLSGAKLCGADLSEAFLCGVDLRGANLESANLAGANLNGADLRTAGVGSTIFTNCDLSQTRGLESLKHRGPSSIGIDTIYKSKGKIPQGFLRECGVPEGLITQIPALVAAVDGIQFYSCFISYSSRDEGFAKRLHGKMRDAHLRVWFAPEEMKGGNLLIEQIETAIRVYDKLLIVLSEASLKSDWVMTELRKARQAEQQSGKRKLFPVRLVDLETLRDWECFDADTGKDLAVEVREYFIPDFSNWKDHDQFEAAFERLLKDLRAEERAK